MSVKLDWQQDLEDEGWPRRHDYGPPNKGPRLGRYALIAAVVLLAAGAAVLWMLNQRGLKAVEADVQETVTYIHWTLQQDDPELTINTLDGISPRWVEQARAEWPRLAAAAQNVPPPSVEDVTMNGDIAETTVRWTDAASGLTYLARRWFRLDGAQWLWTQPRATDSDDLQTEQLAHVTLSFHPDDGEIALTILPQLDDMIAGRCQQLGVSDQSCHFYIRWDVADSNGQPLLWQDMPLPPLAATTGDEMDAPIFLVNGRQADWQSAELRRRLQEYYPGRAFVAQSTVEMLRPDGVRGLPASLLGDPFHPLILPSPALEGIDDNGQPHPRWLAHADRLLTDLVMRKAAGYTLGSARYVNGTWALHQALLAIATGLPAANQLVTTDNEAPPGALPVEMPDLAGLGAALQSNPDEVALSQLAGLVHYLQAGWSTQQLDRLPQRLGIAASLDLLLQELLADDEESFTAGWREQELAQPDSPLAGLVDTLADLTRQEAAAWQIGRPMALELYSPEGRSWRVRHQQENEIFGVLRYDDGQWEVTVNDIGSTGQTVWVDLSESDGVLSERDLRFFTKDPTLGWLRAAPVQSYWGNSRSISSDLVSWSYYEIDETAVQAVAPQLEEAYRRVTENLGLPAPPISVTVAADTMVTWDPDQWVGAVDAPSPRKYISLKPDDDEADALRREVITRMIIHAWQQKVLQLNAANLPDNDRTWNTLVSAVIAEFEAFDIPTDTLLSQTELVVTRVLEQGRLPEISELVAQPVAPNSDIRAQSQTLLAMYIFERHGFQWLDSAMNDGLAATLDLIMQQAGWTLDDLEADWREWLAERQTLRVSRP